MTGIVQTQRCDVCREITLLEFATPFSVDGKMVAQYGPGARTRRFTNISGKVLYRRSGTEELARRATDGCDLCRLFLQSLVYQCSSAKQEWNMRTFQGQITIYFFPDRLQLELHYFMKAKIAYIPANLTGESRGYFSTQSGGDQLSNSEREDRNAQKPLASKQERRS